MGTDYLVKRPQQMLGEVELDPGKSMFLREKENEPKKKR